jgi:hypothetical protein
VALLGRNKAIGIDYPRSCSPLLTGTSTRNLDPRSSSPSSRPGAADPGLVVLFVGADVLILTLFSLN